MRRLIWIAAAGLALLGAGIAVAHEGHANSIAPVSATFTATTASNVHTDTCTGTDGTYTTTRGRWSGAVSGDTTNNLNGNATIDAQIVTGQSGEVEVPMIALHSSATEPHPLLVSSSHFKRNATREAHLPNTSSR